MINPIAKDYGITGPGPTRYSGEFPESEPESKAVADFTREHNFEYTIAFHSQGEVIYWLFGDEIPQGARELGDYFSKVSGYKLDETSGSANYSGYKDWFIQEYNRPGYTVEVGIGENPLPDDQFEDIYDDVLEILLPPDV
jgi:g-D-glutamyl-meso-diaminopimelate peptidase